MGDVSKALASLPPQFKVLVSTVTPTLGVTEFKLCDPNPLRWSLIIGPPINTGSGVAQASWVSPASGFVANTQGIPITSAQPPLDINFRDHGALVQQAWYGAVESTAGGGKFFIVEVIIQQ